ncbi:putative methyltransferase PMT3 [Silene latifolia]|uniref:putative methyltransferase PMT3 n=1 Tax=Silene latifolia TaxID=37657 RepID=UPI003D777C3E
MRGRAEDIQKKRLVTGLLVAAIFIGFLYVYKESLFGSEGSSASALEYGSKSLKKFGWGADEEADETSSNITQDDGEDGLVLKSFPVCDDRHSELIPCLDRHLIYQLRLKLDLSLMEHYERHCPPQERHYNCLIPPPHGYKVPIKWPKSRDEVWKANIPHTHLAHEKSDQNWMVVKGEKIVFPGGGTHFHYGADKYIAAMANMLNFPKNVINNKGKLRTVLDVGCGVASFGGYLLSSDVITMSLAPNDVHQNQIQFALERGIPAYLGVLGTKRLPYPSRSFELAHCSRCRIDWLQRDGILLLELDRLLRPGGYFAYSSPEAYAQDEEDLRIWKEMSALVERMCWKIASKKNQTVIWVKPLNNDCYMQRPPGTQPPLCRSNDDPDAVSGVNMEACITPYSDHDHKAGGSELAPWPARLTSPPPRLADFGYSSKMFEKDTDVWKHRVENYWNLLSPKIKSDSVRNVMDMKANLGSFAAALKNKDVWVMNVVPDDGPNTLKLIYDRGLIGAVHNWCEAFSTYPRTYDLLHAWNIISEIEKKGCSPEDLLLEMDRILRPTGFAIFRDKKSVVDFIMKYLPALHWEVIATENANTDSEQDGDEVVFIVRKKLWLSTRNSGESE